MNNNMSFLKKLTFGLTALVLAFGLIFTVSAFKNKKSTLASKIYYHDGENDRYLETPPEGTSCQEDDFYCTITFEGEEVPTVSEFPEGNLPLGNWTAINGDPGSYQ